MEPTGPPKSNPLHNFDLPRLKWITTPNSSEGGHHRRRTIKSPSPRPRAPPASPVIRPPSSYSIPAPTPSPLRQFPVQEFAALSVNESPVRGDFVIKRSPVLGGSSQLSPIPDSYLKSPPVDGGRERLTSVQEDALRQFRTGSEDWTKLTKGNPMVYRGKHSRYSSSGSMRTSSPTAEKDKEKIVMKPKAATVDPPPVMTKILIKIPNMGKKVEEGNSPDEAPKMTNNAGADNEVLEEGELKDSEYEAKISDDEIKYWNLRPRKPKAKMQNADFGAFGAEYGDVSRNPGNANKNESPMKKLNKSGEKESNCVDGGDEKDKEKKEKKKLSIFVALKKEEIEEDIFALTGSKPARRPKKRAKNIQKKLDAVFPGLSLVSITSDSYKVSENYMKG